MIAITVSLLLVIACLAGATVAYFTDTEFAKTNTITIGDVEIDLYEHSEDYAATNPSDDTLKTNDTNYRDVFLKADANINLLPGESVPKYTYIDNTGKNDAYVRFVVTVPAELNEYLTLTWNDNYTVTTKAGVPNVYYAVRNAALPAGQLSEYGLKNVSLDIDLTEKDLAGFNNAFNVVDGKKTRDFNITVEAHAVQTVGFDTPAKAFEAFDGENALISAEDLENEKSAPVQP